MLRNIHLRQTLRAIGALVSIVALVAVATPAAATANGSKTERFCGYVMDRLQSGQESSRVLRQDCASSQKGLEGELGVAANTWLLTVYEHANFNTDGLVRVWYGEYGPCDSEGYGIRDLDTYYDDINDKISSWQRGAVSCSAVYMHIDANYSGGHAYWYWYNQVPYVGDYVNDKISSIHIHYAP